MDGSFQRCLARSWNPHNIMENPSYSKRFQDDLRTNGLWNKKVRDISYDSVFLFLVSFPIFPAVTPKIIETQCGLQEKYVSIKGKTSGYRMRSTWKQDRKDMKNILPLKDHKMIMNSLD